MRNNQHSLKKIITSVFFLLFFGLYAYGFQHAYEVTNNTPGEHWIGFLSFLAVLLISAMTWDVLKITFTMPATYFDRFYFHTWRAVGYFLAYGGYGVILAAISHSWLAGYRVVLVASAFLAVLFALLVYKDYAELDLACRVWVEATKKEGVEAA